MDFIEKVLTGLRSHVSGIGCKVDAETPCPYKTDKGFPFDFFCCSNLMNNAIDVIEQQKAEVVRLTEKLDRYKKSRDYWMKETHETREKIAHVVNLEEENGELRGELEEARKGIENLSAALKTEQAQLVQQGFLEKKISHLTAKLDMATAEREKAIDEREKAKKRVACLSEQFEKLKADFEGMKHDRDFWQGETGRLHKELLKKVVEVPEDACIREEVVNCPRCDFRTSFKFIIRQQKPTTKRKAVVLGSSPRKYANCPECGKLINSMDNPEACGHCGAWVEWGSEDGK